MAGLVRHPHMLGYKFICPHNISSVGSLLQVCHLVSVSKAFNASLAANLKFSTLKPGYYCQLCGWVFKSTLYTCIYEHHWKSHYILFWKIIWSCHNFELQSFSDLVFLFTTRWHWSWTIILNSWSWPSRGEN